MMKYQIYLRIILVTRLLKTIESLSVHPKNLAWSGGPLHLECEHGTDFWVNSGRHVRNNVVAIKALTHMDEIYVITPRLLHGVIATLWQVVRGRRGVELQPYPDLRSHDVNDCDAIQNAVDFYLDHLGNLWVLDTGVVETLEAPRCTCPPKVVEISLLLGMLTRQISLASLSEPASLLQNIIVEYGLGGKPFIYVSDASRGAILVHEALTGSEWTMSVCGPSPGLQLALVKRGPSHSLLLLVRFRQQGLLELDTAVLRRKSSHSPPLRVYGEQHKPVVLLGSSTHHVYLRHAECSDVLSWNIRDSFNTSNLRNIHSAGPQLTPTSVVMCPLKNVLLVLDSNYGDAIQGHLPAYHRISFIGY